MNYYLDTEFLEGTQKKTFLGINVGETKHTIDLISIGIVAEDNREYYAISKDFNLKEAWNRYDLKHKRVSDTGTITVREYWIRENVLKPIYQEILDKNYSFNHHEPFTYKNLESVIRNYGKSNEQIAKEIEEFTDTSIKRYGEFGEYTLTPPKFYAYFADYDWVAFCWLFGKMMDLPNGFPMYCRDLKQEFDNKINTIDVFKAAKLRGFSQREIEDMYNYSSKNNTIPNVELLIKGMKEYPKQQNEHNALDDARWNKKLHKFIKSI